MSDEHIKVLREMRRLGTPPCNFAHDPEELAALDAAIAALGGEWRPIASRPQDAGTHLIASASGMVAPVVRGIIQNDVGTANDWQFGEAATHWMPLPAPPSKEG